MNASPQPRVLRIATRESKLALWQANYVADELRRVAPDCEVRLAPLTTQGDRDRTSALASLGGVGVFTREVQRAVLEDSADLAVHSLKDLPTDSAPGLVLAGVPPREARHDALLLRSGASGTLLELPQGAVVGTGSPRRRAQLLAARPDLDLREIRGNVETRIAKLDRGEYQAIILAEAGLRRLGLANRIAEVLAPPLLYPAVGQAALGIECRADDEELIDSLGRLSDPTTLAEVIAERACLRSLRAGCHAPVGVRTVVGGNRLELTAVVIAPDGSQRFEQTGDGPVDTAAAIGETVAHKLIEQGAEVLLR